MRINNTCLLWWCGDHWYLEQEPFCWNLGHQPEWSRWRHGHRKCPRLSKKCGLERERQWPNSSWKRIAFWGSFFLFWFVSFRTRRNSCNFKVSWKDLIEMSMAQRTWIYAERVIHVCMSMNTQTYISMQKWNCYYLTNGFFPPISYLETFQTYRRVGRIVQRIPTT